MIGKWTTNTVRLKKMNFSKSDKLFELASVDSTERRELMKKLKIIRCTLQCAFWVSVSLLPIAEVWHSNSQKASIFSGDFSSVNPFWRSFLISLGAFTLLGAAHADHRVKMLILLDSLERNLATKNSAEHGADGKASPAIT